jgi:hypothetical protein
MGDRIQRNTQSTVIFGRTISQWLGVDLRYVVMADPSNPNSDGDPDVQAGDAMSDLDEVSAGTQPLMVDTDGDGIGDATELALGLDPLNTDTDGDGFSDGYELANAANDFDPLVPDDGMSASEEAALFAKGAICGDLTNLCPLVGDGDADTIPYIMGGLVSSLGGPVPDFRDVLGSLAHGDFIGTALNGVGFIPIAGDAVAGARKVIHAADRLPPERVVRLVRALSKIDVVPGGIKDWIVDAITDGALSKLISHGMDDAGKARLIAKGVDLKALAKAVAGASSVLTSPFLKWRAGEAALRGLPGFIADKGVGFADPILGGARRFRIVDAWNPATRAALESKVGFQGLTQAGIDRIILQIQKDKSLLNADVFASVEWHFFPSDASGTVGAAQEFFDALIANGIPYVIHLPIGPGG